MVALSHLLLLEGKRNQNLNFATSVFFLGGGVGCIPVKVISFVSNEKSIQNLVAVNFQF